MIEDEMQVVGAGKATVMNRLVYEAEQHTYVMMAYACRQWIMACLEQQSDASSAAGDTEPSSGLRDTSKANPIWCGRYGGEESN